MSRPVLNKEMDEGAGRVLEAWRQEQAELFVEEVEAFLKEQEKLSDPAEEMEIGGLSHNPYEPQPVTVKHMWGHYSDCVTERPMNEAEKAALHEVRRVETERAQ